MNPAESASLARALDPKSLERREVVPIGPIATGEPAPWSTDADYKRARAIVRDRAGGTCEAQTPDCTSRPTQVHHRAGRGFAGCHHPDLLLAVCGAGNLDGCHGYIHASRPRAEAHGWLLPRGTTADDLDGAS